MSGNQDQEREIKPRLRFPEFRKTSGWQPETIGDSCEAFSGGTPSTSNKKLYGGTIPFIRSAEIDRDNTELFLADEALINSAAKMVRKGDILVALYGANSGEVALSKIDGAINQAILCLRHENNNAFVYQYLVHKKNWIVSTYIQGGQGNLSGEIIKSIKLYFPNSKEQDKIIDCLSSLDELITAETQKLGALKAHKKGLMQQLFPLEGEAVPRLRFPEFCDAPKWEEKRLDDLAKRGTGHTPNKAMADFYNGGIKWISLADSQRLDKGLISETAINISQHGIDNSSAVLHPEGTVVLSRDAGVGKSGIMGMAMAVSQHFIAWSCHDHRLSNWFLYYILQRLKPEFERVANGSTIKTIGMPFFSALRITVPEFVEQQRIADCLFSLDSELTAEAEKLVALKTYKKGLMQQLFPAPEVGL